MRAITFRIWNCGNSGTRVKEQVEVYQSTDLRELKLEKEGINGRFKALEEEENCSCEDYGRKGRRQTLEGRSPVGRARVISDGCEVFK